jgi:hypothetical protein
VDLRGLRVLNPYFIRIGRRGVEAATELYTVISNAMKVNIRLLFCNKVITIIITVNAINISIIIIKAKIFGILNNIVIISIKGLLENTFEPLYFK